MGNREGYDPGTFCWVDLSTDDPKDAKRFYAELFGWDAADTRTGDTGVYTMMRLDGDAVAGAFEQPAQDREAGVPPHWLSYVRVEDADEVAEGVAERGGQVHVEPFDIEGVGRLAVLRDPDGAFFAVWQPRTHFGAARVNEPGCLCWNELVTRGLETATDFYSAVFDWSIEPVDTGGGPRILAIHTSAGGRNGNIRLVDEGGAEAPGYWVAYFGVESCGETATKAAELGGAVLIEPTDIPAGQLAALSDPQGATFGVVSGEMDE
jgi:predicted enzyme related to lactoylglutathione lyase